MYFSSLIFNWETLRVYNYLSQADVRNEEIVLIYSIFIIVSGMCFSTYNCQKPTFQTLLVTFQNSLY